MLMKTAQLFKILKCNKMKEVKINTGIFFDD